ncbi:MAG TPA: hypothetical protein VK636_15440, partial [Gemmatimonadaceae bacterium]|nr:hypothetical protein [Gemmatimonadaceae bacterium]
MPSPQCAFSQLARQAPASMSLFVVPSSHSSPGSTTPSPQLGALQFERHAPELEPLFVPSSHSSRGSMTPSPH